MVMVMIIMLATTTKQMLSYENGPNKYKTLDIQMEEMKQFFKLITFCFCF